MKRFSFLVFLLVFLTLGCAHSPSPAPSQSSSPSAPPSQPGVVLAVSSSEAFKTKIGFEACLTSPYFHDSWCHAPKGGAWRLRPKSSEVSGIDGRTEDRKNLKESSKAEDEAAADPPESFKSSPESSAQSGTESAEGQEDFEDGPQGEEKEITAIPDPLEPFNRAMFHFNDKLYFWVLKPVAQGYNKVVPEPARVGVKNFFSNLGFPARFVSCLLQADFKGAATQLGRFVVNTVWGVGGLLDPSSSEQLNIPKQDADLGQTLGIYGLGQGFYIVWPFLGPSSARDSVN
ncbi:MAG: hypothetical protein C0407_18175, partial [Desulfobacca sp.]|nr:hypothetical protein [Desulfobacca sp.]